MILFYRFFEIADDIKDVSCRISRHLVLCKYLKINFVKTTYKEFQKVEVILREKLKPESKGIF